MSGIFGSASNISFVENALVIRISPSTQLAIGPAVEFTVRQYQLNMVKTTGSKCGWENRYNEYGGKDYIYLLIKMNESINHTRSFSKHLLVKGT